MNVATQRLRTLNELGHEDCVAELLQCCACRSWAEAVARARPFADRQALLAAAELAWTATGPAEWLEAFAAHPRIGQRKQGSDQSSRWSAQEQGAAPDSEVADRLAACNDAYFEKFGFVFLICATGKSPGEMLGALEQRLHSDRETELKTAAAEQAKITALRLEKYLSQ
ncbi:MAG: 2-oxo-4-hydroxy-4-carboxy-5-ureidoimidazoline decarboxylase [Candidatus Eremiobacteraeota bacterium]|nr:2-oxo-4-hydroxy-4-carboxy-5-ureidoimidazoline decarboxylase [Candidatus Eremiobacteraeota bacterium]